MFHPPPRQPHPHGAIPHRYSATGEISFSWFQARTPRRILFSPVARHPNYRHALPALSEGGGRRRGTRREVGVFQRKPFNRRCMRQGRGMFHPLPVSPSPTGRFPIDTAPRERFTSPGFRRELPEESCFPQWHGIRTIAMHCPPPRKGAGGGRGSGREVRVFSRG